ncbi:class I SAM-dependent methyltransferase [Roseibacillus persicicus]|nr:class I SAM-dependent methyltransferase [Roseibacillus persicicus]
MHDCIPSLQALGSESHRLLHGRGGMFEGLEHVAIDWFAPVLLVTFYAAKDENRSLIAELVKRARSNSEVSAVVVQERHLPKAPKKTVYGELPDQAYASEAGLRYHLALERNQNHGFFLDMKPGRDWLRSEAQGRRVLNLFAYTCSLSVAALAGGAEAVVNLDMAGGALSTGRKNHQLNFAQETCQRASYLPHDLFKSWGRLVRGAPYDLIVIDPPSNQGKSFYAEKDYPKILRRLPELLSSQSQVLACLNAPHLGESFLTDLFANYRNHGRLPSAAGFDDHTPDAALKCIVFSPS